MPLQAAEHWLALISHRVKVTKHNFQILLRQHKPMQSHLRTMRKEAREQARDRSLPTTPRKEHNRAVQEAVKAMKAKLYSSKRADHKGSRKPCSTKTHRLPSTHRRPRLATATQHPPLRHHPP
mmetsp:Transcript_13495/g.19359  ORF Transcript_13495/g.19359 Transcript_13495/m.19359 type:complete len:123 (+) Transcript_13495:1776-2144(+)